MEDKTAIDTSLYELCLSVTYLGLIGPFVDVQVAPAVVCSKVRRLHTATVGWVMSQSLVFLLQSEERRRPRRHGS
jgi:hypothetical protein